MKKGNDLPVPTPGRYRKYPLDTLWIGEYLEFDRESDAARQLGINENGRKSRGTVHIAKRLRNAAKHYMQRHPGVSFVVRTDIDANVVRVWRTG